jgi:hypothetical protein
MRTYAQQATVPPAPAAKSRAAAMPIHSGPAVPIAAADTDFTQIPARTNAHVLDGTGASFHDNKLYRHAAGAGPAMAPPLVHEVLRGQGRPLAPDVRRDAEARLGHNFADVRIHTDARAGASAQAVAANAYTVGRQIVFAPGRFEPGSAQGQRLLAHELTHVAAHPSGAPTPSGDLRISAPNEAAERHATSVAQGVTVSGAAAPSAQPGLFRQTAAVVPLAGVSVNHPRVSVPPAAGLTFSASKTPANATGVTFTLAGDAASIVAGTTINSTTGAITVAAAQTGGSALATASQTITEDDGSSHTSTKTVWFYFTAKPTGISSTSASQGSESDMYGGQFTHTFTSPGPGQSALENSHVNERFAAASGTTLALTGTLGSANINVNPPNDAARGWDLDASGIMTGPDDVTWSNTVDARPFVVNASHPTPASTLPQALTATQDFRNLSYPARTYDAGAVATTTHRRAIEDRGNRIKAVTSANATGISQEIVEDYVGPTIFRRCRAAPNSIPVIPPPSSGGTAAVPTTATIEVDAEGQAATPVFSVRAPELGCTISANGVLTPGSIAGTVTVRAGDAENYDETTVTLTAVAGQAAPGTAPTQPVAPPAP